MRAWTRYATDRLTSPDAQAPAGAPPTPWLHVACIAPYVYEALRQDGDERAESLRSNVLGRELVSSTMDAGARVAGDVLRRGGVPHAFIKGVANRLVFGDELPMRISTDVDVLVASRWFDTAERALAEAGFAKRPFSRPLHQALSYERVYVGHVGSAKFSLDLHRSLAAWPLVGRLANSVLRTRRLVDGLSIPSDANIALVAAVHHVKTAPGLDLRDALDLYLALEAGVDDEALSECAREAECAGALYALVQRVLWLLGNHRPAERLRRRLTEVLSSAHRLIIDAVLPPGPRRPQTYSRPHQLADDWTRHALCLGGATMASLEMGRILGALAVDHAGLTLSGRR